MLGIHYASKDLVEHILESTGQRANLVATVCNEMLKHLAHDQRILNKEAVARALLSRAVQDALVDWTQLASDEKAARLDRVIVYTTVEVGRFKLSEVINTLEKYHYAYIADQLTQLLACLELAFIIRQVEGHYAYCYLCLGKCY